MTVFLALLPAYILSIFYRSFLSVIANPVMADLGIGARELGFLSAAWFICFALAQFPVGWALDRVGPRRTVAVCMVLGSAGAFLFALSSHAAVSVIGMGLIGLGCSPVFMSALFVFARTAAPGHFGFLTSVFIGLGSLGNLAGAAPLALAAEHFSWRSAMLAMAGCFLLAALLAIALLRDPPRSAMAGHKHEGLISGLRSIFTIRALWLLAPITLTGYAIVATARGLWIGPYMADVHGLDRIASGNAATAMAVAMIVGAFLYGGLEQRLRRGKPLVLWGSVLTGLCFAALAVWGGQSTVLAISLFTLIGATGFTYAVLMAHARLFFPEHLIGRGVTFINFLMIAGAAAVQSGSGWLIEASRQNGLSAADAFAQVYWGFAALLLLPAAIYALTPERPAKTL